jgi:DNA-binding protein H-NS
MAVDIKGLNHTQLKELISKAQLRQSELGKEKITKLRDKVHALIKAEGYTFDEVFGAARGKVKRTTTPVAPTWSGRGKRPHWFNDALKAGKKEKDLAI